MVCGIKEDRFVLCNAFRFDVQFSRFCWNVFSDFEDYFFLYSFVSISKRDKKNLLRCSFSLQGVVKFICKTKSLALHKGGGIFFVRKNLVTELISVMMITGVVAPQTICPKSLKAK